MGEHINVVCIGSGGVGKTMLAENLAHRAILAGHTARFVSAADMLGALAAQDGSANRRRRSAAPRLLRRSNRISLDGP
jgi:DNA replication protein DnaC